MANEFNRSDIDHYLYLIAKEYKKQNRLNPEAEIVLIGGSALLLRYNFRDTTTDIDGLFRTSSNIKEIITKIGDENNLGNDWINDDFKKTTSFSPKLVECSKFYKKFCNCLSVRIISDEYLIAMKIRSFRNYKHDISDIVGIIKEHQELDISLNLDKIENAYEFLYEEKIPQDIAEKIASIFTSKDLEDLFYKIQETEQQNKESLLIAENKYDNLVNEKNANIIAENITKKRFSDVHNIFSDSNNKVNSRKPSQKHKNLR